jgi:O-antigen ligase
LAGSRILLALLVVAILAGVSAFLADKGYIATFFNSQKTDLVSYAQDVYLGPRLAYAVAALTTFEEHPFSGVGLGASGFEIYRNMPDWALSGEPEIARQMSPNSDLYPNPKNLFIRLLAETGLPGFMLFIGFYLALFAETLQLLHSEHATSSARWLATAGVFALTAVVLQGISQDSFAMPEMWVNLGILAGAAGAYNNIKTTHDQKEWQ